MDTSHSIALAGDQTIATIDTACARLRQGLGASQRVVVEMADLGAADLSTVQLLLAARRSADAQGKQLHITGMGSEFRALLVRAGVDPAALLDPGTTEGAQP